jgi:phosphate starvation-inducible PhoH-like protein
MNVYQKLLERINPAIVVVTGPAGTGKTMNACTIGKKLVDAKVYDKIVLTRPAVSVERELGFIPGKLNDKMLPWLKPSISYLGKSKFEVSPLSYMRGMTFNRSWVIADEMQNSTEREMLMLLTRIGTSSKFIIMGDLDQTDGEFTGLKTLVDKISRYDSENIKHVELTEVRRSPIINEIFSLYKS